MSRHLLCSLPSSVLSSFGLTDVRLSFIYILQLVNEEEPAQSSQEVSAQEAPPPYSSIAAANAGNR